MSKRYYPGKKNVSYTNAKQLEEIKAHQKKRRVKNTTRWRENAKQKHQTIVFRKLIYSVEEQIDFYLYQILCTQTNDANAFTIALCIDKFTHIFALLSLVCALLHSTTNRKKMYQKEIQILSFAK